MNKYLPMSVVEAAECAKSACSYMLDLTTSDKNKLLEIMARALVDNADVILRANAEDVANCKKSASFVDRLKLTNERIAQMAKGLTDLIPLPDPIGEVIAKTERPNGLAIKKIREPFGVVAIIYEARPNVTSDVVGLCLKTGNCVVLRGSKDAAKSNNAIVNVMKAAVQDADYNSDFIQQADESTRESVNELIKLKGLIDVALPRGSASLINFVTENASVPVIETGAGNCHCYVHKSADLDSATAIILNGKIQRPSVCNALESVLIDREILNSYLPVLVKALNENGVKIHGCSECVKVCSEIVLATEDDYYAEYSGLEISVKCVSNVDEAIAHINKHGTHHSDTIIAKDVAAVERFIKYVDSAAVYSNASTRFTDGGEFGFGAEVGISTQKLHARGPMGLVEMTTYKYVIEGNGQIRR